ncbi:XF1762 family protein [Micromonospora sp. NPDC048170]|uniref:XF1762 family protein n=1 Tax=Micromonospora sp. NPDC048170 TaxID=3154819 RepID=UPI003400FD9C
MSLRTVPVTFAQACAFVQDWHRHHRPPRGHKFSVGAADHNNVLVGVAVVGRPVSRMLDDGLTLEVTRVATDGTRNANSLLYAAAWQATRALGYRRLVYTQDGESGASLQAAGWRIVTIRPPAPDWSRPSRPRADHGTAHIGRQRWHAPT